MKEELHHWSQVWMNELEKFEQLTRLAAVLWMEWTDQACTLGNEIAEVVGQWNC